MRFLFALLIIGAIAVVATFLMMIELLITMLPLVIVAVAVIMIVRLGRTTSHRVVLVPPPTPLTPRAGEAAGPAVYRYRGTSHPLLPALQGWVLVLIRLAGPDAARPDVIDAEVIGEGGHDA